MLYGLDLFTGIGGLTIALSPWVKPIAYCESDRFAQGVILSRIFDMSLPNAGIWDDVRTLNGDTLSVVPDIIYGGFPCQDISVAGHGLGLEGKRSGLFFEILRLADEISPTYIFLENVPAIRTRGGERVGKELARRGYDCRWDVVSAEQVGAPHLRKRWFFLASHPDGQKKIVADATDDRIGRWFEFEESRQGPRNVANSLRGRQRLPKKEICTGRHGPFHSSWWTTEPDMDRVADGVPARVDRLRTLGNAVVPLQAREAFKRLMGFKNVTFEKS